MKKLFLHIAALMLCVATASSHAAPPPIVASTIVMPWDLSHNAKLPAELRSRGFSHATVYLNWSDIESRKGQYEFSHYHAYLDAIIQGGLSLILVLDMGGRPYKDDNGQLVPNRYTVPTWLIAEQPDALMKNFSGDPSWQLDFTDAAVQKHAQAFIAQAVNHFSRRYDGKVLGYAIGLQEEHEIKYGQMGYQWRDYKESTQSEFAKKYGAKQPIINYNNNIAGGVPKVEPLLYAHKEFRENRLKDAACAYARTIRNQGAQAMGYFAETFTSHDAIYATGIVEKLTECLDVAIIDFNFYDGYGLVADANVLPALANYLGSLGYQKIMVGAYAERWEAEGKTRELMPVMQRAITQSLSQDRVIGYEIGGIAHQSGSSSPLADLQMNKLVPPPTSPTAVDKRLGRIRIGVLGSTANFHVWHGERSAGRNIHRDALFAAYQLLASHNDMDVRIIGEKNLLQDNDPVLQNLDAIVIPHQVALPQQLKTRLTAFWKRGGALIQDMRLGEFDENGKPTFDWMHEVFGIADVEWKNHGGIFLIDKAIYRLKPSRRQYTGYAAITPRPGYKLLATELLRSDKGIMVRGVRTLTFGLMPQLAEGPTAEAWKNLFVQEIKNTLPPKKVTSSN